MADAVADPEGPNNRTASFAPAAGQNFAETTAKASRATRLSSPEVSPNMSRSSNPWRPGPQTETGLFTRGVSGYHRLAMSEMSRSYVIGLGANLGDRLATLCSALVALGQCGLLRAVSAIYESAPVGPAQPDFLNAAVLLESMLGPQALLADLLGIERAHGRERRERWGPRTLDLDLLCAGELVLDEPGLSLPHLELPSRAFALMPLLDVLPEARDPRSGATYAQHLAGLERHDVRRLETPPGWRVPDRFVSLQGERNTSAV